VAFGKRSPNLDLRNQNGRTVLHLAALQGNDSTVQVLLSDRRYNSIVQEMLGLKGSAGSFVHRPDNAGKTALHLAAGAGHVQIICTLIDDQNVNATRQCMHGRTALMDGCRQHSTSARSPSSALWEL
jgi:ankyrin repeat protein